MRGGQSSVNAQAWGVTTLGQQQRRQGRQRGREEPRLRLLLGQQVLQAPLVLGLEEALQELRQHRLQRLERQALAPRAGNPSTPDVGAWRPPFAALPAAAAAAEQRLQQVRKQQSALKRQRQQEVLQLQVQQKRQSPGHMRRSLGQPLHEPA
jgi:hypothetical protein